MTITGIAVDALKRYNNNAKEHPQEQIDKIAESIRQFGFRQPIVVDSSNVVVIGHGRLLAAKALGMKQVPCVVIDDLTEDEINALRLIDNKLNESKWDFSALEDELATIVDIDMWDYGFEPFSEQEMEAATAAFQERVEAMAQETRPDGQEGPYERGYTVGQRETSPYATAGNYGVSGRPANQLQATYPHDEYGYVDEYGRQIVGERSLIEANREYRYVCPRCKHRFN